MTYFSQLFNEKIVPNLSVLESLGKIFRNSKRKVVLANGIFDILHVGHIRYLQESKNMGHILVVAVNSDTSTKRLKGKGRPITPEKERVELISAFQCVDFVILFEEDTVEKVIEALKPDFQSKGREYTVENIPEKEIVERFGGKCIVRGDEKNHSTTEIIKKLKGT